MINYISKLYFLIICDIAIPPYFIRYFAHLSFPAHCARLRFFVDYFQLNLRPFRWLYTFYANTCGQKCRNRQHSVALSLMMS